MLINYIYNTHEVIYFHGNYKALENIFETFFLRNGDRYIFYT